MLQQLTKKARFLAGGSALLEAQAKRLRRAREVLQFETAEAPASDMGAGAGGSAGGAGGGGGGGVESVASLLAFDGSCEASRAYLLAAAAPGPYPARGACGACGRGAPAERCQQCGARCCAVRRCRDEHVAGGRCSVKPQR
jgi:hypothetical protein